MKVVVCVKQIPDPATPYRLETGTNWLTRPDEQILDDTDRYGVEMGLQIAQPSEGSVTLVSMGPAGNGQGIRQALAMGADKAVLIEDPDLRGSDALTTARALAAAIAQGVADVRAGAVAVIDARVAPEYSRAVSSSLMRNLPARN